VCVCVLTDENQYVFYDFENKKGKKLKINCA